MSYFLLFSIFGVRSRNISVKVRLFTPAENMYEMCQKVNRNLTKHVTIFYRSRVLVSRHILNGAVNTPILYQICLRRHA